MNSPQIQHIIANADAAVDSTSAQILKNRPKYQQTPSRRLATKAFTTMTTSATTETTATVPESLPTMPDSGGGGVYTVRPKTKSEESKQTKIRGRIRRPGKKRTTTTTESALEANNELPLDENYPRITAQQLPVTATGQQQPLYDDNFDNVPQQYVPGHQNRPVQFYEETGENVSV